MSNGADMASAIGRDGARQDTMYPKPTTTWSIKNMINSNQYMVLLYNENHEKTEIYYNHLIQTCTSKTFIKHAIKNREMSGFIPTIQ